MGDRAAAGAQEGAGRQAIWVLAELRRGEIVEPALEALTEAREIAGRTGGEVTALVPGEAPEAALKACGEHGARRCVLVAGAALAIYRPRPFLEALAPILAARSPSLLLVPATAVGADFAPRIATRLRCPLITRGIRFEPDTEATGRWRVVRSVYAGRLHATLRAPSPLIVTTPPRALDRDPLPRAILPEVERVGSTEHAAEDGRYRVLERTPAPTGAIPLGEAEVVVAVGAGARDETGFRLVEELAEALGAALGGSRMAVDAGWLGPERQIGQSGVSIAPRVYVACGISGAPQHTAGMREARHVLVINSDRHAPICALADLALIGDLREVVPRLTAELRAGRRPPELGAA